MAQLDKASDYESEDWGFESLQGYLFCLHKNSLREQKQKIHPRWDSNPQSSAPETDALSIWPQGHDLCKTVRRPGIEPGPPAWKAGILATELSTHLLVKAFDGIRTRDLSLTKRVLCQLSYEGKQRMENPGFDPGASSLRTTHSTDSVSYTHLTLPTKA